MMIKRKKDINVRNNLCLKKEEKRNETKKYKYKRNKNTRKPKNDK